MERDRIAVRIIVSGRVQGVGFRWFTRAEARRLGLTGWVRNLRDGSVEAEVTGSQEQIDALLDPLRSGPPSSKVTAVSVHPLPGGSADSGGEEAAAGFEVRSTV